MNTSRRRIAMGTAFAVVAIVSNIAPASAMGRYTTPRYQQTSTAVISDRLTRGEFAGSQMVTALQAQVEALRQELAELKARVEIAQGIASAD